MVCLNRFMCVALVMPCCQSEHAERRRGRHKEVVAHVEGRTRGEQNKVVQKQQVNTGYELR